MWQIFEEALTTYRQEWENLLLVVSPALVLGPIAALIAGSGLLAAVVTLPVLVLLCVLAYAACVRAAVLILSNLTPDPGDAYLSVLARAADVLRAATPSAIMLAVVTGAVLAIVRFGGPPVGVLACALGAVVVLVWTARHAYDQPLIFVEGLTGREALHIGAELARDHSMWTLILVAALSSPLVVGAFVSWGVAAAVAPPLGVASFCVAIALWLPFLAVGLTNACARMD